MRLKTNLIEQHRAKLMSLIIVNQTIGEKIFKRKHFQCIGNKTMTIKRSAVCRLETSNKTSFSM